MKRNATYIHATVSGPSDGSGLSDTPYPYEYTVYPNDLLASLYAVDIIHSTNQLTPLPMGIALIVESFDGTLQRSSPFFEVEYGTEVVYPDDYDQALVSYCPNPLLPVCNNIAIFGLIDVPLIPTTVHISELLMTPISNFIEPNSWAQYYFECGRNLIRREEISQCPYEHVLTKYSEFLRKDLVNRGPTSCDKGVVFDPLTLARADYSEQIKD